VSTEQLRKALSKARELILTEPTSIEGWISKDDAAQHVATAIASLRASPPVTEEEPIGWVYKGIAAHTTGRHVFEQQRIKKLEERWWEELGPVYLSSPPQERLGEKK